MPRYRGVQPTVVVAAAFPRGYAAAGSGAARSRGQTAANLLALFEATPRAGDVRLVLVGSATAYGQGGAPRNPTQGL